MLAFLASLAVYAGICLGVDLIWHFAFKWPWEKVYKSVLFNAALYTAIYFLMVVGRWVIWGSQ